jgi:hypothetical protein
MERKDQAGSAQSLNAANITKLSEPGLFSVRRRL